MNRKRIENSIRETIDCIPLIPVDELYAMPFITMEEHDYITKQVDTRKNSRLRYVMAAASCCMVILALAIGWYLQNRVPYSIIMLDVNPSIEIRTNHKDKVISILPLNDDAREIINENIEVNTTLEDTVTLLISSLVEYDYINEEKKTILLTVTNKSSQKADEMLLLTESFIKDSLAANNISPVILSQVITSDADREKLAKSYHISEGKMKLISEMISINEEWTVDMLAKLSMEELLKLAGQYRMDLSSYLSLDKNAELINDNGSQENQENPSSDIQMDSSIDSDQVASPKENISSEDNDKEGNKVSNTPIRNNREDGKKTSENTNQEDADEQGVEDNRNTTNGDKDNRGDIRDDEDIQEEDQKDNLEIGDDNSDNDKEDNDEGDNRDSDQGDGGEEDNVPLEDNSENETGASENEEDNRDEGYQDDSSQEDYNQEDDESNITEQDKEQNGDTDGEYTDSSENNDTVGYYDEADSYGEDDGE